jgi:hypothetical protein
MMRSHSLLSLRTSLLAAMGLGLGACGSNVTVDGHSSGQTGSGDATAGSGVTGSGTGGNPSGVCQSPATILDKNGATTGFEKCADGTIRRVEAVAVDPTIDAAACAGTEASIQCMTDAECTARPHGKCGSFQGIQFGGPATYCGCVYACASDAECNQGEVCVNAGVVSTSVTWPICAPATCVTSKDCPSDECGISSYNNGCGVDVELSCRSATDACRLDADCTGTSTLPPGSCVLTGYPTTWRCASPSCAIGRPLLVDGRAETAAPAERGDWALSDLPIDLSDLDPGTRAALAQHWLDVAALEHASVASFARFTLSLLALGAPPALVADAQRAGLDEVEHARVAYALASAYAGRRFGPGPLDLSGVTLSTDRREALRALIHEACVGETLGVAEALAVASLVRDPALQRVHARIAGDEQRHAELAWRTLAWLLQGADDATARFAARCFDEAVAAAQRDPAPRPRVAEEHGLLSARALGAIRRQALGDVIAPCAAALLERRDEALAMAEAS